MRTDGHATTGNVRPTDNPANDTDMVTKGYADTTISSGVVSAAFGDVPVPTADDHLANMQYVSSEITALNALDRRVVPTPTQNAHCANKEYTDTTLSSSVPDLTNVNTPTSTQTAYCANVAYTSSKLTGLQSVSTPTADGHLANRGYVNTQINGISIPSFTSVADPTADAHLANKGYVDGVVAAAVTDLTNVPTPTADTHCANKAYNDARVLALATTYNPQVPDLTNVSDPTADSHCANKQYTDSAIDTQSIPNMPGSSSTYDTYCANRLFATTVPTPTADSHQANKGYADSAVDLQNVADMPGSSATYDNYLANRKFVTTVPTPTASSHQSNKGYADSAVDLQNVADVPGSSSTYDNYCANKKYADDTINLQSLPDITGSGPVYDNYCANKKYVDDNINFTSVATPTNDGDLVPKSYVDKGRTMIGANVSNPLCAVHTKPTNLSTHAYNLTDYNQAAIIIENQASTDRWALHGRNNIADPQNPEYRLNFTYNMTRQGYLKGESSSSAWMNNNLTVSHSCMPAQPETITHADTGKVVRIVENRGLPPFCAIDGQMRHDVSEALPFVEICDTQNDQRVYGVIAYVEDKNNENRQYPSLNAFMSDYPKPFKKEARVRVNTGGEGSVWVIAPINTGMVIQIGDWLSSSGLVAGYADAQTSDDFENYTFAKSTCACVFDAPAQPKYIIKTDPVTNEIQYEANTNKIMLEATNETEHIYATRYLTVAGTETGFGSVDVAYVAKLIGCMYML